MKSHTHGVRMRLELLCLSHELYGVADAADTLIR